MSSASAPSPLPGHSAPAGPKLAPVAPEVVRPAPKRPRKGRLWIWLSLAVILAAAAGLFLKQRAATSQATAKGTAAPFRTAVVFTGDLQKTVRISGVISAERYSSLLAPQLFGSRSGYGRQGAGGGGGGGSSNSSNASGSNASSSSTSASTSSSATGSSASPAAPQTSNTASNPNAAPAGTSSLGAIRGTTNRFGDRSPGSTGGGKGASSNSSNSSSPSTGSGSTSSSMGPNGLGSTAGNLIGSNQRGSGAGGGGGGMGGGGDFMLVLTSVANPGSHVKKGDVVAEFDRQYQLLRLDDYKASLIQMEMNIKKMEADLAVAKEAHDQLVRSAKADLDKARLDLKTAEVRSAIEAEKLKLAVEEADAHYKQLLAEVSLVEASQRSQLRSSRLDRDKAKIELQRATNNVDRMVMKAPIDGVVVMQSIFRGGDFGQVQQGDQIYPGMTFMQIVDPSSMVISGSVNQVDAEAIRLGMPATTRFDAYPGMELPAHVIGIGAMTKPGVWRPTYMRELPVRLKLDKMDPRVIPDLSASADVVLATEKQATVAPLEAVFHESEAEKPFVFLKSPAGWRRQEVELGLKNHIAAAILSGLQKGDVLAAERPVTPEKN